MINKLNEELDRLPMWLKIVLGVIMTTLITVMSFLFIGIAHVSALTPVEANFIYDSNGTQTTYNIKPDGGTTGFIYNNEFFGQEINHSSYRYYKLPGSTLKTTNINGYFQNPCQSNEEMSYTMTINFYKQSTSTNTMSGVSVINGINGCSGYLSQLPDSVVYYNVCTIQPGDVPKFSLYFDESSSGMTTYRVGIPINFSYTCQVGNQAVIDNATANANNIVNNIVKSASDITNTTVNIIYKMEELDTYCDIIDKNKVTEQNKALVNATGEAVTSNGLGVTDYIKLTSLSKIRLLNKQTTMQMNVCFYTSKKTYISCFKQQDLTQGQMLTIPENAYYVRFTIDNNSNLPIWDHCTSNTQAMMNAEDELWDNWMARKEEMFAMEEEDREQEKGLLQNILSAISDIFSDDVDDPTSDLNSLSGNLTSDSPISNLLLLPVRIYQNVVNNINGTCNTFNLGSLYGHDLTMTCIRVDSFLGNALYGVIDVIISGLFVYVIRKKFVQIFINLSSLKTGGNELE